MQAKRKETMKIKEIKQILHYEARAFLERLTAEVQELQDKGYDVEVQYSTCDQFTALIIARETKVTHLEELEKKNANNKNSKSVR